MTEENTKPIATYTVYDYGDGNDELKLAMKAGQMHSSIWELLNDVLRPVWKHGSDEVQSGHYEKVKDDLWQILRDNGIADLF
jgi:hypothetical protein